MTSEYSEIYSRFYMRITDYNLVEMDESLANELLKGYLRNAASKPYVRRLFSSLKLDDDAEEATYDLRASWDEDSDKDFVEEMLAIGMVVEWVRPQYQTTLLTLQMITNSDQRFYSQKNHMDGLKEMFDKSQLDLRKMIRDRGYSLGYIGGAEQL